MSEKKKNGGEENSGNKSKLIIIVLVAIIVVFAAGVAAYFFVFSKKPNTNQQRQVQNASTQQVDVKEKTYSFTEVLTNLADTDSAKYVKVTVAVGYNASDSKLQKELEDTKSDIKTPILRDVIVNVLRSKKASDFTQSGIEQMKKEIKDQMNPHLENGQINNVYFSDLVIQQ